MKGWQIGLAFGVAALAIQPASELRAQAPAPEFPVRAIRVSGVGEVRTQPDLATIQFGVETVGTTAEAAGRQNSELMERVIQALLNAGVERGDIETSGFSLYPEYAPQPRGAELEPPRIRGYRASNQVQVRTGELEQIGALIDAGLAAGANNLQGVYFELRNSETARAQALQRAVEEARAAAMTIAAALGVTLGPVLDASTNAEPIQPFFRGVPAPSAAPLDMMGEAAMVTPIEPGEQVVRAYASIVFGIQ